MAAIEHVLFLCLEERATVRTRVEVTENRQWDIAQLITAAYLKGPCHQRVDMGFWIGSPPQCLMHLMCDFSSLKGLSEPHPPRNIRKAGKVASKSCPALETHQGQKGEKG